MALDVRVSDRAALTAPVAAPGAETPADALKVFISYSRVDMEAADRMVADLERNGFAVTIDRRDLPYGEEWQKELAEFIAASDTVVWLVSPESVKSKWVNWELGEVGRLSKRLLPVKVAETDPATLPEALGRIHLLPAEGVYETSRHGADLVQALNTDRAWLKKATSLSDDAREWLAASRDGAHLLRGRALAEAEAWSARSPRNVPAPASEILELILASRLGQDRRRRMTVTGSFAAAIFAIGLAATAVWFGLEARDQATEAERQRLVAEQNEETANAQRLEAERQRGIAEENEKRAKAEREATLVAEASRTASVAQPFMANGRPDIAMALALEVAPRSPDDGRVITTEIDRLLRRAYDVTPAPIERRVADNAYRLAISADGRWLAVGTAGDAKGIVQIFNADTLREQARFQAVNEHVQDLSFSPDGRSIVVGGGDKKSGVWDVETGNLRFELPLPGDRSWTKLARFSPDGSYIVVSTADNVALVFDAATGEPRHSLPGPDMEGMLERLSDKIEDSSDPWPTSLPEMQYQMFGAAMDIAISADSEKIAVTGWVNLDGAVNVYNARDGSLVHALTGGKGALLSAVDSTAYNMVFSADGKTLFGSPRADTLKAWDLATGTLRVESPSRDVSGFVALSDGRTVIAGHHSGAITVRCMEGLPELVSIQAHTDAVQWIAIDEKLQLMVSTSSDNTAKVWRLPWSAEVCEANTSEETEALAAMKPLYVLVGSRSPVFRAVFAADGSTIFTVSQDGFLRAWPIPTDRLPAVGPIAAWDDESDDIQTGVVVIGDGSKVFIETSDKSWIVDVATNEAAEVKDVRAVAPAGPGELARFFYAVDQYWTDGSTHSVERTLDAWKGPVNRGGTRGIRFEGDKWSDDRVPILVDVELGKDLARLQVEGRTADIYRLFFSPDGNLLFASLDSDEDAGDAIAAWDAGTGALIAVSSPLEGYSLGYNHHFSNDGKTIFVEDDTEAHVLRLTDAGFNAAKPPVGRRSASARSLSNDGSLIAEPREDGTVVLTSTDGSSPRTVRRVSDQSITTVALSSDSSVIATVDIADTLRLTSAADGELLRSYQMMADAYAVRFLPDGKNVFIIDRGGRVATLSLRPAEDISDDPVAFVDWLRASRHSLVRDIDQAAFGLSGAARGRRADLEAIRPYEVAPKLLNPVANADAAECDRLAANVYDHNRRAAGVIFDVLDPEAAMQFCTRALAQAPEDPQTRYQMGRLNDKLGNAQLAINDYLLAAEANYGAAARGIARLLDLDKTGNLKAHGDSAYWTDRAASMGDPWTLWVKATNVVSDVPFGERIGEAMAMLSASGIPNRAQAAMVLGSRLFHSGDSSELREKAHHFALLGLELFDTVEDPAPFTDSSILRFATDFVRDQARSLDPPTLVDRYRRARDWRAN